jgi:acyl carrier protein
MSDLRLALRAALVSQFRIDRAGLRDDTALFSSGLIDSLSVMDLVCFVEGQIGLSVPPEEITLKNFDSIARIAAYADALAAAGKGK